MNFSARIQTTNNLSPFIRRPLLKYEKKEEEDMMGSGILNSAYDRLKQLPNFAKKAVNIVSSPAGNTVTNVASRLISNNPHQKPGFPGEKHIFMNTPEGFTKSNFAGPGTNLEARLARGDRGINQIDEASKLHDIAYSLAKDEQDIRKADNEMIKRVKAATDSSELQKNIVIGALKAKKLGEDTGFFDIDQFTELKNLKGSGMSNFHMRIKPNASQILASQYYKTQKPKPLPIKQEGKGIGVLLASTLGPLVIKEVAKLFKKKKRKR